MKRFEEFSKHTRYKEIPMRKFIDKVLDKLEKTGHSESNLILKTIANWINENLIGKEVSFHYKDDKLMEPFILKECQYTAEQKIRLTDQNGESRNIGIVDMIVYMQVKIEVDVVFKDVDPFDEENWDED